MDSEDKPENNTNKKKKKPEPLEGTSGLHLGDEYADKPLSN